MRISFENNTVMRNGKKVRGVRD